MPPSSRLPVAELVAHAYQDVIANSSSFIRISLIWLVIVSGLSLIALPLNSPIGWMAIFVGSAIGSAAVAVAWHRHVVLNEAFPIWGAPANRRLGRYLLNAGLLHVLAVIAPGLAVIVVAVAIGRLTGIPELTKPLAGLSVLVVTSLLASRLQLLLVASAVDDRLGPLGAWRLTRGHGVRILAGTLLSVLPAGGAASLMTFVGAFLGGIGLKGVGSVLLLLSGPIGAWLMVPLVAAFLSFSYLWFRATTNDRRPQDGTPFAAGPG